MDLECTETQDTSSNNCWHSRGPNSAVPYAKLQRLRLRYLPALGCHLEKVPATWKKISKCAGGYKLFVICFIKPSICFIEPYEKFGHGLKTCFKWLNCTSEAVVNKIYSKMTVTIMIGYWAFWSPSQCILYRDILWNCQKHIERWGEINILTGLIVQKQLFETQQGTWRKCAERIRLLNRLKANLYWVKYGEYEEFFFISARSGRTLELSIRTPKILFTYCPEYSESALGTAASALQPQRATCLNCSWFEHLWNKLVQEGAKFSF